jgi:ADP-ribosylation factor-binding protein GGA
MVQEEGDDTEAVTKLLELNETIKADLEKYDKLRKGDFQGAQQVAIKPMYSPLWISN